MGILIGADLVPTKTNEKLFAQGDSKALLGEKLHAILEEADCRIFNLETPLTDAVSPIAKCGPNLMAPTACITGYKAMGVDILSLANNHIMDQGCQGFYETCRLLKANDIAFLGAGSTPREAAEPFIFTCNGKKIGIYACAEHEFSIVTENSPGANPFDPLESPDHVAELKAECDYVIVLYHGGKEHYRYPSPGLQKICRKLVEKGADLVLCQHSHCIGCEEKYAGGTIVYGQGNFLFDHSKSEFWQTGMLVYLDELLQVSYVPLVKDGKAVKLAEGKVAREIEKAFRQRSDQLLQPGFVEENYAAYAKEMLDGYLVCITGVQGSFFVKVMNKLTGGAYGRRLARRRLKKREHLALQNYVECEAHAELMLSGLKQSR